MSPALAGKAAIVTGAAGGIGAAIAVELAAQGTDIYVLDAKPAEAAAPAIAEIETHGRVCSYLAVDLTNEDHVVQSLGAILAQRDISVLVNCAGFAFHEPLERVTAASWRRIMDINLTAPFLVAREAAPHMYERGYGRIINIGSEQAALGDPNLAHYTAAKAGLLALTKSLAIRYAPVVNVNLVAPGPTATDKFKAGPHYSALTRDSLPLKRFGEPQDIALTVAFLAGPGGDFYTGAQLDPNGGAYLPSPANR